MELFDIFDEKLPPRVNEFLGYLVTIKGKSLNTVKGYKCDLKMYLTYIKKVKFKIRGNVDIDISDLDDDFLKSINLSDNYTFITHITIENHNGECARARKIAAIRSFFKYLETKIKIIQENPAKELETPKIGERLPVYLSLEESKSLLNAIDGENKERDFCIITLFLNCGMRLSELISINLSKLKGDTITVIGKGNKERTIYFTEACQSALKDYLAVRPIPKNKEDEDALFLSERRRRISKRTVQIIIKKYTRKIGLTNQKYTPHKLRHSATCC